MKGQRNEVIYKILLSYMRFFKSTWARLFVGLSHGLCILKMSWMSEVRTLRSSVQKSTLSQFFKKAKWSSLWVVEREPVKATEMASEGQIGVLVVQSSLLRQVGFFKIPNSVFIFEKKSLKSWKKFKEQYAMYRQLSGSLAEDMAFQNT